jgi:UDP-N-acetylmuramate-alanine ligase
MFSTEHLMQLMPEEQLNKVLMSPQISKEQEAKYLINLKPEILAQMIEGITGQPAPGAENIGMDGKPQYDKNQLYGMLTSLDDDKFKEATLFIPTVNKQAFVSSLINDNPELLKAKELGLKIFSLPDYLYLQTRSKTRIVVAGNKNKTITTAMILFVLKKLRIETDYLVNADIEGFDNRVKLSYESRIAVFEGDEYLTSTMEERPKFHFYKPQIAVLTGIEWELSDAYPTFPVYLEQFSKFIDLMEVQGRLIYFDIDENLKVITEKLRRDIVSFAYNTPANEVRNGITYLKTKKAEIALKVSGEQNLQNIEGARLACKQIGVTDNQFYSAIGEFPGIL